MVQALTHSEIKAKWFKMRREKAQERQENLMSHVHQYVQMKIHVQKRVNSRALLGLQS